MNIEIKGQCEHDGQFFKGKVSQGYIDKHKGGVVHTCGKVTENWDEAYAVDVLNKNESIAPEYVEVSFA